jgi:DNA-binding MarR family transcriptional regulator
MLLCCGWRRGPPESPRHRQSQAVTVLHPNAIDPTISQAVDAFRRIVYAVRLSARRAERELGLSGAQLFVLQQLGERPADSVNELAERTHTHQSSVSVVVRRLVERGLVVRTPAPQDGRRVQLNLSPRGRTALRRTRPVAQLSLIQALSRLRPAQRQRLVALLHLLVREMGLGASPARLMFADLEGPYGPRAASPARR